MHTLFISDLHLSDEQPHLLALFYKFCTEIAPHAERLFIQGDLFEYWIGDDDDLPWHKQVIATLHTLAERIPIFFQHGNRDFLIGKQFAHHANMQLLPDEFIFDLYGQRVLLMHGDSLCIDDEAYQRFRRFSRHPLIKTIFLLRTLRGRRRYVERGRIRSQMHQQQSQSNIMDVNQTAVETVMRKHDVHCLIHGHTHRPAVHKWQEGIISLQRIVLSDWKQQGNYLLADASGSFSLDYFSLY
jgi:UDP-2,3-diacylglucosamine hydrolase